MLPTHKATRNVLSIGDDYGLLWIREMVLHQAGYRVFSRTSLDVLDAVELPAFDMVVFCHTVSMQRAEKIAEFLRSYHPGVRIIRLSQTDCIRTSLFDSICDPTLGPRTLLHELDGAGVRSEYP